VDIGSSASIAAKVLNVDRRANLLVYIGMGRDSAYDGR